MIVNISTVSLTRNRTTYFFPVPKSLFTRKLLPSHTLADKPEGVLATVSLQCAIRKSFRSVYSSSAWISAFAPEGKNVQWAIVQKSSKGFLLQAHGIDATAEPAAASVATIVKDARYTVSILPSSSTLCRQIALPPLPAKDVPAAMRDTLEQTLAVGIEESSIALESVTAEDGSLTVTAYLARQPAIVDHLERIQALGINPEWVLPKAACLGAFAGHFTLEGWQYIVDINVDEITTVLAFGGRVVESRSLTGGSATFSRLDVASQESDEQLKNTLQHLAETIWAYKERYGIEAGSLTVTGDVLSYPLAAPLIAEFLGTQLSPLHSAQGEASLLKCATAIGAAFLSQRADEIPSFRTGQFAFSHPFLHWKRPLLALALGSILAASLVVWRGHMRAEAILASMRTDWQKITESAHITPEEVNNQTKGSVIAVDYTLAPPEQLLVQGEWLLSSLERKASFPLQPNIPRVREILSWVASVITEISSTPPSLNGRCEVLNFQYQLAKHPTKNHPKERYQVRVDLEIATPSVALARAFHERLISDTKWIDQSSEVKWLPSNGKYRVSFFLLDKTLYPPNEP